MEKILTYWRKKTPAERVELWYFALIVTCLSVFLYDIYTKEIVQAIIMFPLIMFTFGCFVGSKIRRDCEKKKEDLEKI